MTQRQLPPHGNIAPPAEPFTSLDDTVRGTVAEIVQRSKRRRIVRIVALILGAALVGAAVTALVLRPHDDAKGMTPDLAVAYVQDEFPGRFPDSAKLKLLFSSTCHVLDEGGTRMQATVPMIDGGLSGEESAYIFGVGVASTCPQYTQR